MSVDYEKVKSLKMKQVSKFKKVYEEDEGRLTDKQIENIRNASAATNTKEEEFDNEYLFNWDGN